jgi:alpha-tubulin suppressor-like RCC1 family protein
MARYVRKEFNTVASTFTIPAGVDNIKITIFDMGDRLGESGRNSTGGPALLRTRSRFVASGINTSGQFGNGTTVDSSILVLGPSFSSGNAQVSISDTHSLYLAGNGSCFASGANATGELGDSTTVAKSITTLVVGNHSFMRISAGANTSFALKADGSVWAWGSGSNGALGDGTISSKSSPVPIIGGHSFIRLSAGLSYAVALKADGTAWTWGNNINGALGDGTVVNKSSPVQVIGGHSFIDISAGGLASYAIKADGTIWSWGANTNGQLGDNTLINKSSPVQVAGGLSFTNVYGGGANGYALTSTGQVHAWGVNTITSYACADGTSISPRSSPVPIIGGHSFNSLFPTTAGAWACRSDGTIWNWGTNGSGVLADGTSTPKQSPTQVVTSNARFSIGSVVLFERNFNVIPGTSYTINTFIMDIANQVQILEIAVNRVAFTVEYYV